ncbi:SNARE PROTEINS [Salix koriyanagi]|uniref:SNARE PROTEINS n=1 Tax=Salix koriyanagi TaxID=2511006 RepID=A0A9Q0Q933_9ROSI|nr:SNARE PROTEINS [Salix koriyanagi]
MGQQTLIYSFVARGTVILAEYTEFKGNFTEIAAQCLEKLPASNNKFTYNCDGHTFNYLVENGFRKYKTGTFFLGKIVLLYTREHKIAWTSACFCKSQFQSSETETSSLLNLRPKRKIQPTVWLQLNLLADKSQLPFWSELRKILTKRYGGGKAATAVAKSLNGEFGSKLKGHMQYCADHPEEISKLAKVKAQVSEVKGVMMENIEKVLDRGEKIELLVDKTENLRSQAQDFRQQGTKMRRKMWLQNMKIKLIVLVFLIYMEYTGSSAGQGPSTKASSKLNSDGSENTDEDWQVSSSLSSSWARFLDLGSSDPENLPM